MPFPDSILDQTLLTSGSALLLALVGALFIGMAKAGLAGCGLVSVVLFAETLGAKASTGVVLPLLIAADLMGFWLLRRGGSWKQVWPLAPPAILGVVIGWWLLDKLDNLLARQAIGWVILALLALKLLLDWKRDQLAHLHRHAIFTWGIGVAAGVTTMLANAAGPVMAVYLLAHRHGKADYLGVFTRFFLFINLVKVPFSAQIGLINGPSLWTNALLLPAVVGGIFLGWRVVKVMSQKVFEWAMFVFALLAAIRLVA
ncbi:sulfite exporter TauE/SafE family protein [Phragmitibacter flavus]|nr:sulfite exporter TauE/SafE family protein [Phragmitibacter flavus]